MNETQLDPDPAFHRVRVGDVAGPAVLVREDATLREVASLLLERQVDNVVVVDRVGAVRGVVTDHDLTLNQRNLRYSAIKVPRLHGRWVTPGDEVEAACVAATTITAGEIMDSRFTTAEQFEPIGIVVERMLRRDADYALALSDGEVVGLLGRRDLLRLVAGRLEPHPVCVADHGTVQQPTAHLARHGTPPVSAWFSQVWT